MASQSSSPVSRQAFRFVGYPVRVYAGGEALDRLGEEADRLRARRVLVVCGQSVARRTNLLERVKEALGDRFAGVFDGAQAGSPLPSVDQGVAAARQVGADAVIALGGGSAVVTARAITILLAEGGTVHDHATRYPPGQPPVSPRLMQPKLPNIAVLTTPTTAATRSGTAVIDPETGHRLEMFDPKTRPSAVFWDHQALLTAPAGLCRSAAAACFSGVAGGLQSKEAPNPLAQGDLSHALTLLRTNLPLVDAQADGGAVRVSLCAAAFLYNRAADAGVGGNSLGVVSALAHTLDTRYPQCGHGAAYSISTAAGMRFNRDHNLAGQARLAALMGRVPSGLEASAADWAAEAVEEFYRGLGLPTRLREAGVPRADLEHIAQDAMTDFGLHRNVRRVKDVSELVELLNGMW
ncbi:MAG TPA: iron-containing alcohol dehydrogenase family protein [Dehalococcoidia bacterium]|nr:iron-containing alcohol dehydrogenase family protein [Dehalococcoidia bacterium]